MDVKCQNIIDTPKLFFQFILFIFRSSDQLGFVKNYKNYFLSVPIVAATAATIGALGVAYHAYRAHQEAKNAKLPTEWQQVGTLKDLYVYPVKSCGPVLLNKAECTILGLKDGWLRDR